MSMISKKCKIIAFASFAAVFFFSMASCGSNQTSDVSLYSPRQMAEVVVASQTDIPDLIPLTPADGLFPEYLSSNYLLEAGDFRDGVVCYAFGVEASEIAILLLGESVSMKTVTDAFADYIERRTSALTGYVPDQADLVERGVIVTHGSYAALFICGDTSGAESAFLSCFGADPPGLPAGVFGEPPASAVPSPDVGGPDGGPDEDGRGAAAPDPSEHDPGGAPVDNGEGQAAASGAPEPDAGATADDPGPADAGDDDPKLPASPSGAPEPNDDGASSASPPSPTGVPVTSPAPEAGAAGAAEPGAGETDVGEPAATSEPPIVDDPYDPASVLAAWRTGDSSSLSDKNRAILEACRNVIGEVISPGMTEYDMELAIHDWIVRGASYDTEANNNSPNAKPSPDHDNPYGLLFNKKAICSGYTSTFQLFMDMLGVECITVNGFARDLQTDHAWNMVRLDGEWYFVDVTWDDPSSYPAGHISHDYFNVTSRHMRDTRHIWDEASFPVATATAYAYRP